MLTHILHGPLSSDTPVRGKGSNHWHVTVSTNALISKSFFEANPSDFRLDGVACRQVFVGGRKDRNGYIEWTLEVLTD